MVTDIHKKYGLIDLPKVKILSIQKSSRKNKKYVIKVDYNNVIKDIHFGDVRYEQYKDRTPIKLYKSLDHGNNERRINYLSRASKIINHNGLSMNDPFSPNRYSMLYLW